MNYLLMYLTFPNLLCADYHAHNNEEVGAHVLQSVLLTVCGVFHELGQDQRDLAIK